MHGDSKDVDYFPSAGHIWKDFVVVSGGEHVFLLSRKDGAQGGFGGGRSVFDIDPKEDANNQEHNPMREISLRCDWDEASILRLYEASEDGNQLLLQLHYLSERTDSAKSYASMPMLFDTKSGEIIPVPLPRRSGELFEGAVHISEELPILSANKIIVDISGEKYAISANDSQEFDSAVISKDGVFGYVVSGTRRLADAFEIYQIDAREVVKQGKAYELRKLMLNSKLEDVSVISLLDCAEDGLTLLLEVRFLIESKDDVDVFETWPFLYDIETGKLSRILNGR